MSHPVDVHVGKRLRLRRTMLGMRQESVAKAIGITFQQVQKYERGINRMSASRLYEFAKLLDVAISYFFEGMEEDTANAVQVKPEGMAEGETEFEYQRLSSRETLEMMRAYYRITDHSTRKSIADLIRSVADGQVSLKQSA